jgi:thiol-disulfide isomerase/thioredoxin
MAPLPLLGPSAAVWLGRVLLGSMLAGMAPQPVSWSSGFYDNPAKLDATMEQAHALALLPILEQDGELLRLAGHPGRLLLIQFWGSWCGYSRADLPQLVTLARDLGSRIAIVLVSSRRDLPANLAWATFRKIPLPQASYQDIPDSLTVAAQIARQLPGRVEETVPVTAIFLPDGTLVQSYVGARAWSDPVVEHELQGFLDLVEETP